MVVGSEVYLMALLGGPWFSLHRSEMFIEDNHINKGTCNSETGSVSLLQKGSKAKAVVYEHSAPTALGITV
jgi:hypothetical protein